MQPKASTDRCEGHTSKETLKKDALFKLSSIKVSSKVKATSRKALDVLFLGVSVCFRSAVE